MERTELTVPDYSASDFLDSSAPYEYLYSFKDDPFALGQMKQRLKAAASKVGVKTFISLWNAYAKSRNNAPKSRQIEVSYSNGTEFDGQPLELFSGRYICKDEGVMGIDRSGNPIVICQHPIMPVRRFVNVDSGDERLEIAYKSGSSYWRSITVAKSILASPSAIVHLADKGIAVNARNANDLSTYLFDMEQLNADVLPEEKSVSRLGWIDGHGFAPFVDGLAFDGEAEYKNLFNSIRTDGSFEKWREAMTQMRSEKTLGRLALAASFASVLIEPCGLLPFFVHLHGSTEFGKTVSLMVAASVWGKPVVGEYITTFNSTSAGLEMLAGFVNSLPLCIDELEIKESQGVRDFDNLIYQLCEGAGKTRSTKIGGLQKIGRWRNCIISSGENTITSFSSKAGAVNRILSVEGSEKIVKDIPPFCDTIRANYGFAGRRFVEWLQDSDNMERAKTLQKDYYKRLLNTDSMDKQAASASALLTADHLATELIFRDGYALTIEDLSEIMAKRDEVDLNQRTYEYINELIVRQKARFVPDKYGEYIGEIWGKIENGYIYMIKSVFDRELSNAGYNSNSFLSWANRRGYLKTNGTHNTCPVRIKDGLVRCAVIRQNEEFNGLSYPDPTEDFPF